MPHYEQDTKLISEVLEELNSNGFEGMAQVKNENSDHFPNTESL